MNEQDFMLIGVIGFVLVTLALGAYSWVTDRNAKRFIEAVNRVLDDKRVKDEVERRYLESSLTVQDFIQVVRSVVSIASTLNLPVIGTTVENLDEFIEDVTDGVVNREEPAPGLDETQELPPLKTDQ